MQGSWIRNAAVISVVSFGAIGGTVVPAAAHYTTTRCDRDGDECYTVRCDDDGDDCRRVSSYSGYNYDRREYRGGYSNGYGYGNGYNSGYGSGYNPHYNNRDHTDGYNNDSYGRYGRGDNDDQ